LGSHTIRHSVGGFITKILRKNADIMDAKHLLFKIYTQDKNWNVFDGNPSGIEINTSSSGKMILTDDYDNFSTWVGTFHNNKLIACGRIISRDDNNLLEIERYPISIKLKEKMSISSMQNLVELNRSAIHRDYRNTVAWPCLLYFAFKYCAKQKLNAISTTSYQKVIDMHKAIGFQIIQGEGFKYYSTDEKKAEVFLATIDNSEIYEIIKKIKKIIEVKLDQVS